MQVLMAMFKLVWNIIFIRKMVSWLSPYEKSVTRLHVGMLVFNSILAPGLATALTDTSCFSDIFTGTSSITSSYSLTTCIESYQVANGNIVNTVCTHYETVTYQTQFYPPFIYYYTCGTKLLTLYTPVFVYLYTILLIASNLVYFCFAAAKTSWIPIWILSKIDGIVRPNDRLKILFERLIRSHSIQALLTQHIVVLLTFGINSPLLAVIMMITISMECFLWQLFIVRYVKYDCKSTPFSPSFNSPSLYAASRTAVSEGEKENDMERNIHDEVDAQVENNDATIDENSSHPLKGPNSQENFNPLQLTTGYVAPRPTLPSNQSQQNPAFMKSKISSRNTKPSSLFILLSELPYQMELSSMASSNSVQEIFQKTASEQARLHELNTVIDDAWLCLYNARWLLFYCSMTFAALILFDCAGDNTGWREAMWLPCVFLFLMFFIRIAFLDLLILFYNHIYLKFCGKEKGNRGLARHPYSHSSSYSAQRNQNPKKEADQFQDEALRGSISLPIDPLQMLEKSEAVNSLPLSTIKSESSEVSEYPNI
jgi:hypothetical protein